MNIPLVDLKANYNSIKPEIDAAIQTIIDNSSFIMGKPVKQFEENFAKASSMKHCIGVANGTVAVELALRVLGVGKNDEVIIPANTFIATSESVTAVGARCVFVDVEEDSMNIDSEKVEQAITPKTKAIIAVHLYGRMANMEKLQEIAKRHDLLLIEDAAQAHLAEFKGKKPGQQSGIATFSFFPAKNLGAFGDAGGIVCNDDEIAKKLGMMRNHGRLSKYEHEFEAFNYRMDALQAAILDVKLEYLEKWNESRRKIAKRYDEMLKGVVGTPPVNADYKQVYYMYEIRTDKRDDLLEFLKEEGVSCGIHYPLPLHLQPAYKYLGYNKGDFPVAEKCADEILSIPIYPELSEEQQDYVVKCIKEFFND
ncbi:MAG: DegT/DnrJ/EryC1/StrS family aminotransferase [Nanoarchaeota archaeon]|nr:DegT/DnrJ/EryC1/StrS family aminotransferase [Nanoarchaeota archaeon]